MAWTSFGVSNVCEALKTQKNPRHAPCPQKIEPDSRGLDPAIHVSKVYPQQKTWIAGTSPAMTETRSVSPPTLLRCRYAGVVDDLGPLLGLGVDKSTEMLRGIARHGEALIGELFFDRWIGHRLVCNAVER